MLGKVALNAITLVLQSSAQLIQIVNQPINLERRLKGNSMYQGGCLCALIVRSTQFTVLLRWQISNI
jgi:hypothetical protein